MHPPPPPPVCRLQGEQYLRGSSFPHRPPQVLEHLGNNHSPPQTGLGVGSVVRDTPWSTHQQCTQLWPHSPPSPAQPSRKGCLRVRVQVPNSRNSKAQTASEAKSHRWGIAVHSSKGERGCRKEEHSRPGPPTHNLSRQPASSDHPGAPPVRIIQLETWGHLRPQRSARFCPGRGDAEGTPEPGRDLKGEPVGDSLGPIAAATTGLMRCPPVQPRDPRDQRAGLWGSASQTSSVCGQITPDSDYKADSDSPGLRWRPRV